MYTGIYLGSTLSTRAFSSQTTGPEKTTQHPLYGTNWRPPCWSKHENAATRVAAQPTTVWRTSCSILERQAHLNQDGKHLSKSVVVLLVPPSCSTHTAVADGVPLLRTLGTSQQTSDPTQGVGLTWSRLEPIHWTTVALWSAKAPGNIFFFHPSAKSKNFNVFFQEDPWSLANVQTWLLTGSNNWWEPGPRWTRIDRRCMFRAFQNNGLILFSSPRRSKMLQTFFQSVFRNRIVA